MTREEAIAVLKDWVVKDWDGYFIGHSSDDVNEALNIAIKALEQEIVLFKSGLLKDCEFCKAKREYDFNKVKAEIEALPKTYPFVNHFDTYVKEDDVRKIIDKYKAESEDGE